MRGTRKLKFILSSLGTQGDLLPMLSLAQELAQRGHGCHVLGILKAIRNKIGKQPADVVHVEVRQDLQEHTVEVPEELLLLFAENPEIGAYFEQHAYTHRLEHARYSSVFPSPRKGCGRCGTRCEEAFPPARTCP